MIVPEDTVAGYVPNNKDVFYMAHKYTEKDKDGKYLAGGEEANFRLCCVRSAKLVEEGWLIYSPITHTHPIHVSWPAFVAGEIHDFWYHFDNAMIDNLNFAGIILCPKWETSKGCIAEKERFEAMGKPVLYYDQITNGI